MAAQTPMNVGARGHDASGLGSRGALRKLGHHELLVRLAAGGAANVFLTRDETAPPPGRLLALKVLLPSLAANDDFLNMFFTEARIAQRLDHPNIVAIAGFGQADGIYCLAMEYVFGASLAQILRASARARKPLTVGVLLRITAQVCDALHYAHELKDENHRPMGLVHRDVTPQNILVGFNGVPKLTDFGIAKATNRGWETQAGIVKGKFSYMSPEQALGKKIDRRSDIFGAGIVLWEALTGKELFKGTSPMEVIQAIRNQPILPPSQVVPGLSSIVDPIVTKALRRAPRHRYQTAAEMKQDIEELIERAGVRIDATEISHELAEVFGNAIVERALALRAAMAARGDVEQLARVLGAQVLRADHLPVIPGGATNPDPLGLFGDAGEDESFAEREESVPARAEAEFTRAIPAVRLPPDPPSNADDATGDGESEDIPGFSTGEFAERPSGEAVAVVAGWEGNTRRLPASDELLGMLSERDLTVSSIPQKFAQRFGHALNPRLTTDRGNESPKSQTSDGLFDDEKTIDGRTLAPSLGLAPGTSQKRNSDFDQAPPTMPALSPSVLLGGSMSAPSARAVGPARSQRPIPRAPSLDMSDGVTPLPQRFEASRQPGGEPLPDRPATPTVNTPTGVSMNADRAPEPVSADIAPGDLVAEASYRGIPVDTQDLPADSPFDSADDESSSDGLVAVDTGSNVFIAEAAIADRAGEVGQSAARDTTTDLKAIRLRPVALFFLALFLVGCGIVIGILSVRYFY